MPLLPENVVPLFPHQQVKWQPVLLLVNDHVLCQCGALGAIVTGEVSRVPATYNALENVDVWCQDCFEQAQRQQE